MEARSLIFFLFTLQCGLHFVICSIKDKVLSADVIPTIVDRNGQLVNGEYLAQAGENVTLKCQCLHHVTWRHFNTTVLNDDDDEEIIKIEIYDRVLNLTNVSASDTGYYYCMLTQTKSGLNFDQDLEYAAEMDEASKVYVYVNDRASPLVPTMSRTIFGSLYTKIVIPCKPSSNNTEVVLLPEINQSNFDPKIGYEFYPTNSTINQTIFVCQPKLPENSTMSIDFKIVLNSSENVINTPRFIDFSKVLTVGDNITITCEVLLKKTDDYEISWKPSHYVDNPTRETDYENNPELKVVQSNFTILVTSETEGLHTCIVKSKASNLTSSRSTYVRVWIEHTPIITFPKDYYIKAGESVTAKCRCQANPPCKIYWLYAQCTFPLERDNCSAKPRTQRMGANVISTKFVVTSTLQFQPRGPGVLSCEGNSNNKFSHKISNLWLDDLDVPFKIHNDNLTDEVVIGDNVTLTCSASVYNYSDVNWYRNSRLLETDNDYEVIQDDTTYSKRKLLTIKNITKSAIYECSTNFSSPEETTIFSFFTGFTDRKFLAVEVKKPLSPEIIYFDPSKDYELPEDKLLHLKCNATGTPKPRITWMKEGNPNPFDTVSSSFIIDRVNQTHAGTYICTATNRLNSTTHNFNVRVKPIKTWKDVITALSIILVVLVLCVICISYRFYRERKLRKNLRDAGLEHFEEGGIDQLNPTIPLDEQADLLPYNRIFDFPKDNLKMGRLLGSGAYGIVLEAMAVGICAHEKETKVAVKMVKKMVQNDVMKALVSELKIMANMGRHLNVVNLLGAVTENIARRDLMIIVEFCQYGNLRHYLLKKRDDFVNQINPTTGQLDPSILNRNQNMNQINANQNNYLTHAELHSLQLAYNGSQSNYDDVHFKNINTTDLILWSFQIARGMDYLASRKVVHGDLAARNILLTENKVVKICDFGLARTMYKTGKYFRNESTYVPIKWLPPESLTDHIFSTSTDIWSFGIVLWELFSLGTTPYPGLEIDHVWFPIWLQSIVKGYRMPRPAYSTEPIYNIMQDCWNLNRKARPSFKDIETILATMLPDIEVKYYVDLNDDNVKWNTEFQSQSNNDYVKILKSLEINGDINVKNLTNKVQMNTGGNDYLPMAPVKIKFEPESQNISAVSDGEQMV